MKDALKAKQCSA